MLNITWTLPIILGLCFACISLICDVLFCIFFCLHAKKHTKADRIAKREKKELDADLAAIKAMTDKIAAIKAKRGLK